MVRFDLKEERETVNADEETVKLRVQGLKGGHSGLDITKERGNANVLLTRILASAEDRTGTKLVTITGGLQNNAICREAVAAVTIAKDKKAELQDLVQEWQKILKKEFKISDPDVKVVLDEAEKAETRFTAEGSAKIIDFMMSLDSGVIAMNMEVPGVAETSGNVGTIVTDNDTVTVRVCYRSGLNSKKEYTIEKSKRLARMAHAGFAVESSSSEWEYKSDSRLSALIQRIYLKRYGQPIKVEVSHGGNECGTFFKHFPDADIVCTGTQIIGPHTPNESVMVSIIQKEWEMLQLELKGMLEY